MKRYVKTNDTLDDNDLRFSIDVFFVPELEPLVATKITPVYRNDGTIDDQALADYYTFIQSTESIMEYYGLKIKHQHNSGSTITAKYFLVAPKSRIDAQNVPRYIYLRIAEHVNELHGEGAKAIRNKMLRILDENKLPPTKLKQKYRPQEIIVNDTTFQTYEDALTFVEQKVREWLSRFGIDISDIEPFDCW